MSGIPRVYADFALTAEAGITQGCDKLRGVMNNDAPPGAFRKTPEGEFTWPPSREELDAIEVIPLGDATIPRPAADTPAKAIAAPAVQRRGQLRLPVRRPRRDDVAFGGVLAASVLAIAVAASMQFSDLWNPASEQVASAAQTSAGPSGQPTELNRPLAPLVAQSLPALSTLALSPLALSPTTMPATAISPAAPVARLASQSSAPAPRRVAAPRPQAAPRAVTRWRAEPAGYTRPRLISPAEGRHGKVVLLVEVRKNGKVGDVDVLSSNLDRKNRGHRDLQRAAVSAVKRWRYEPALRDGQPADTQMRVVVDINLDSSRVSFTGANARRRAAAANRAADSVLAAR
jgi:periplasmic protein TonB